uniref:Arm-DNA-bind_5 domain-containing protein n=1 Tax=Caenorhabditis tropicalis TaxID=1561998 RepID=A0A1I7U7Y4_9PELO
MQCGNKMRQKLRPARHLPTRLFKNKKAHEARDGELADSDHSANLSEIEFYLKFYDYAKKTEKYIRA